jgi:hypothetical protein
MAYTSVATGDRILASTINDLIKYALNPALVRLAQTAAQSIPDNTQTALTFTGAEDIDVYGFHDPTTNTSRITPNIPGTYLFFGSYFTDSATATTISIDCSIRKNGATVLPTGSRGPLTASFVQSQDAIATFDMNGSTDYTELMALQDSNAAANSRVNARFASHFSCILLGYSL